MNSAVAFERNNRGEAELHLSYVSDAFKLAMLEMEALKTGKLTR